MEKSFVVACSCLFKALFCYILYCRFLFWTEDEAVIRFNLADSIKITLTSYVGDGGAITLDCIKKRVYWLEDSKLIKSCDYHGKDMRTITSGRFMKDLLGVLGDSLYFLDRNELRINEMNVSNGNTSQTILLERESYRDLIIVDKSLQPTGMY